MVKTDFLSSDINFIKEFEELKLKQKLLVDTLNKKTHTQQNQLFMDINSKLDFLVKIFKEANESENNEEQNLIETHFTDLSKKLDELQKSFDEKFEALQNKLSGFESKVKEDTKELSLDSQNESTSTNLDNTVPPVPNFEVATSVDNVVKENYKEKKKKWF